jgi:hypothetical protein
MTPTELENLLWPEAQATAGNMQFAPECELELRQLIRNSATSVTPETLDDAIQNLRTLVSDMHSRAQNGILQEWTLREALASLCPLFPFC